MFVQAPSPPSLPIPEDSHPSFSLVQDGSDVINVLLTSSLPVRGFEFSVAATTDYSLVSSVMDSETFAVTLNPSAGTVTALGLNGAVLDNADGLVVASFAANISQSADFCIEEVPLFVNTYIHKYIRRRENIVHMLA